MIFVLKLKWDAEAVRMYQEGLEKQLKEAKKAIVSAEAQGEHKKAFETA